MDGTSAKAALHTDVTKTSSSFIAADTWRSRSMASWRARLGVMASRGETSGARVAECQEALTNWRLRTFLIQECGYTEARADELVDMALQTSGGAAVTKTPVGRGLSGSPPQPGSQEAR